MKVILFLAALVAFIWLWSKYSEYRDIKKKEEYERDLTYQANSVKYLPDKYLEKGEIKNGWARIKLAEHRYAYISPDGKSIRYMTPDYIYCHRYDGYITHVINEDNPNSNIFEEAEEFDYQSAIVKRQGQAALLSSKSTYLIPFESPLFGRRIESSLRDIGNGLLEYWKTVHNEDSSRESTHAIFDRNGKELFRGDFSKASVKDGHLVVICNEFPWGEETIDIELHSGKVLLPRHAVAYELENGMILFYSRYTGTSGWNVYDLTNQSCVFSKYYEGIAYLKQKKAYLLIKSGFSTIIADEAGRPLRELPMSLNTVYDEQLFSGPYSIVDFEGNTIAEVSDGSLSFIQSQQGDCSSKIHFWGTNHLDKKPRLPFEKSQEGKVLFVISHNYEDHTYRIIDLNGNTIIGPVSDSIEPDYSSDGELINFRVKADGYRKWHRYSLSGEYLDKIVHNPAYENAFDEDFDYPSFLTDDLNPIQEIEEYDLFEGQPISVPVYTPKKHHIIFASSDPKKVGLDNSCFLFFDTETTGIPKDYNAPVTDLNNWPRVVQLSWIVTDSQGNELKIRDYIIKPEGFSIPTESSRVHGITTAIANRDGVPLQNVLAELLSDLESATTIVGHNVDFDKKVVGSEFCRCGIERSSLNKPTVCTMKSSTDFCKLPGKYGYKWPTLLELHKILFGEGFGNAHNSLSDIQATKKCFFKLKALGIIN